MATDDDIPVIPVVNFQYADSEEWREFLKTIFHHEDQFRNSKCGRHLLGELAAPFTVGLYSTLSETSDDDTAMHAAFILQKIVVIPNLGEVVEGYYALKNAAAEAIETLRDCAINLAFFSEADAPYKRVCGITLVKSLLVHSLRGDDYWYEFDHLFTMAFYDFELFPLPESVDMSPLFPYPRNAHMFLDGLLQLSPELQKKFMDTYLHRIVEYFSDETGAHLLECANTLYQSGKHAQRYLAFLMFKTINGIIFNFPKKVAKVSESSSNA